MKKSILLGMMGLLAACGGSSGTQAVIDTPDVPEPPVVEVPVAEIPEVVEPVPEEPVIYTLDTGDEVTFDPATGRFNLGGRDVNVADFDQIAEIDGASFSRSSDQYYRFVSFVDGESFAVAGVTNPLLAQPSVTFEVQELDGHVFSVPTLDVTPTGSAAFAGNYAGYLLRIDVVDENFVDNNGVRPQSVSRRITGNVSLLVDFAEVLSDSTLSGSITNRQLYAVDTSSLGVDRLDGLDGLRDATITNGRIGDDGAFVADLTGGEKFSIFDGDTRGFESETDSNVVVGQLGGSNGETIAGGVRINHIIVDAQDRLSAVDELYNLETGVFIANQTD